MTTSITSTTKHFVSPIITSNAENIKEPKQTSDKIASQILANKTEQQQIEQITKEQIDQNNLPLLTPPTVEKDAQALADRLAKLLPTVMNLLGVSDAQLLSLLNKIATTLRELNTKSRNNGDQLKIITLQSSERVKDSKYTEAGSLMTSALSGSLTSVGITLLGAGISFKGVSTNDISNLQNKTMITGTAVSSLSNPMGQVIQQPLASDQIKEQGNQRILETEQQINNATGETHQREENINDEVKNKLIQILNKMIEYSQQTVSTISGNIRA